MTAPWCCLISQRTSHAGLTRDAQWQAADAISARLILLVLQMCILDGNAYDAKCLEAGQERDEDLDACSLLVNNKMQPLLSPSGAAAHNPQSKVVVQLTVRHRSPSPPTERATVMTVSIKIFLTVHAFL